VSALGFASRDEWEAWLAERHADEREAWVKIVKKGARVPGVSYEDAVETALCYGWIDGLARSLDEDFYAQRFTPRRPRSGWSRSNRDRVARLIEAGRMQPAGLAEVERAQAEGRWDGT
jgi:uncharacterized protein YdeI (YjbR/CyaY-like superfamily)